MIVAYYCDHNDEPASARTHVDEGGNATPSTVRSVTFGTYDYSSGTYKRPPCPRALALRVTAKRLASMREAAS